MGNLIQKKKATKDPMEVQADFIARAIVREFRAVALGLGWALAPGLFFGFLFLGAICSICTGFVWFVWTSL